MIIPIRCVTCGKVIADKWREYERKVAAAAGTAAPEGRWLARARWTSWGCTGRFAISPGRIGYLGGATGGEAYGLLN
eukprot:jgi/Tetstr1/439532/TSEL_027961.t1